MTATALPVRAVEAPFDRDLMRVAEILGSLQFLRTLCGQGTDGWRAEMERLLAAENPDPARRARFVASFNRGYRAFSASYTACSPAASTAIERYTGEGRALIRDILARYGG